jgi:hypothetical protein
VGPRDKEALERAVLLSAPLYLKKKKTQRKHKISALEMARCYFIPYVELDCEKLEEIQDSTWGENKLLDPFCSSQFPSDLEATDEGRINISYNFRFVFPDISFIIFHDV